MAALILMILCMNVVHISCLPAKRDFPSSITAADIIKAAPSTESCDNAPAAGECATAADAAPYIACSFSNFGIDSFGAQAALLALMLYESGNFKYSRNHFPGVPGQGTRNMQSPAFNLKYAQWLSTVCLNCGITPSDVSTAQASGPAAVLDLVNIPQWSFSSAAWFLDTQCDASIKKGLADGSLASWQAYIEQCVGTTLTDDRTQVWKAVSSLQAW